MESMKVPDYIESTQQQWDEEYQSQMWDYLSGITEYARYSVVYGYIRKFLSSEGILDMGCGTGILFDMLLDKEKEGYLGVDLSHEAVKIATAKSSAEIFAAETLMNISLRSTTMSLFLMNLYSMYQTPHRSCLNIPGF